MAIEIRVEKKQPIPLEVFLTAFTVLQEEYYILIPDFFFSLPIDKFQSHVRDYKPVLKRIVKKMLHSPWFPIVHLTIIIFVVRTEGQNIFGR